MEFVEIGQFIAAFVLVIGLIGLMGVLMRRYGNPAMRVKGRHEARLALVESLPIDARSRLLLIRRDGVEHLLVKSAEQITVVETAIGGYSSHPSAPLHDSEAEATAPSREPRLAFSDRKTDDEDPR